LFNRKGVSEIIAAMLLIVITVAAAVLMYAYTSDLFGRLQGVAVQQPYLEQVALDYYDWTTTTNGRFSPLKLTLRNVGVAKVTMSDFFIAGVRNSTDLTFNGCAKAILNVQTSCVVTFPVPSTLLSTITPGLAYSVRIGTINGAIFSYSCIAGQVA
jgi:flagellin-like protein